MFRFSKFVYLSCIGDVTVGAISSKNYYLWKRFENWNLCICLSLPALVWKSQTFTFQYYSMGGKRSNE